jgi:hypothetical protein
MGSVVLSFLLLCAWRFYLERMATGDSSFFSWLLLDQEKPYAALGRYGSILPQLVPLIMIRTHASLEAVLRSYSVAIIGIHLLTFVLLGWRLKDTRATIVLPITLVAGTRVMFYFGISELYQGLSVLLIVWVLAGRAWQEKQAERAWRWGIVAVLLNLWAGLYHQLLVIPLVFLLGHEWLHGRLRRDAGSIALAVILVSWYVLRLSVMSGSEYEQARMPTVEAFWRYGLQLTRLSSTSHLLHVWWSFKSFLLLVLVSSLSLAYLRRWRSLLWTVFFSMGFLVLILITDRDGGSPTIYENYYPVLAFIWAVVFAESWVTLGAERWPWFRSLALPAVLLLGCLQVYRGHYPFTDKVDYLTRTTATLRARGIQKALIHPECYPWPYAWGEWALAFESALVSADRGSSEVVTLFIDRPELSLDSTMHQGNAFFGPTWYPTWFTSGNLPMHYFRFASTGYKRVNTRNHTLNVGQSIVLRHEHDRPSLPPAPLAVVPLWLDNTDTAALASLARSGGAVELRYKILGAKAAEAFWHVTPLEMDVPPHSSQRQGLIVERPVSDAPFTIEVGLFDGDRSLARPITIEVDVPSGYSLRSFTADRTPPQ